MDEKKIDDSGWAVSFPAEFEAVLSLWDGKKRENSNQIIDTWLPTHESAGKVTITHRGRRAHNLYFFQLWARVHDVLLENFIVGDRNSDMTQNL